MDKLEIKYRTTGKAIPPQPIRMAIPGWGGPEGEKKNGMEPRPWHCPPFVEASTYGLELLYPYEKECHVINDNGEIRFAWDYPNEPDAKLLGDEFAGFFPKPSKFYLFNTNLDIKAPPGHVIRTEPHPRFYTDETGTVPLPMVGHVQTEWWPKTLFIVFRAPHFAERHIFRKGEPYCQIFFVPQLVQHELSKMDLEEEAHRQKLERDIIAAGAHIANNVWQNPAGHEFKDHYKVLGRAFAVDGIAGVDAVVNDAAQRLEQLTPKNKSIEECLALGYQHQKEQKYIEARTVYLYVLSRDPKNVEALSRLAILAISMEAPDTAIQMMSQAVASQPRAPGLHNNLGEMLRRTGRFDEAEISFRSSLQLNPNDAQVKSNLGQTLAQKGQIQEGLRICREAIQMDSRVPLAHVRLGLILAHQQQCDEARACFEKALALDPSCIDAHRALQQLPEKGT